MNMLLNQSFIYLLARGVPALVTFAAIAAYTRLLTAEEYGYYALTMAWVTLAGAVFFQWLRLALTRFAAGYEGSRKSFVSTVAAGYVLLLAVTAAAGLLLAVLPGTGDTRLLIAAAMLYFWVNACSELVLENLRARIRPLAYGAMAVAKSALGVSLAVLFIWLGAGVPGLLAGLSLGMLLPMALFAARRLRMISAKAVDRRLLARFVRYGLPLTATFALEFVVGTSDRILIEMFAGAAASGVYAVGYDVARSSLGLFMMVINMAAFPLALKAMREKSEAEFKKQLSDSIELLLAVAVPAACGLALIAGNIASVMLGSEFAGAARLMPLIALCTLLNGIKLYHFDRSFQLREKTHEQIWVAAGSAAVSIGLNLLLIPALGITGAALSAAAAYTVAISLSIALGRRHFRMPFPWRKAVRVAAATAVMAALLWPLRGFGGLSALLMQIAAGAAAYGLAAAALDVAGVRTRALAKIRAGWGAVRRNVHADS